jgi:hypothetical protein
MVERLRALQRIQGEFKVHFETLDTLFNEHVTLQDVDGLDEVSTVERVLAALVNHVREDVERIHDRARPIAEINRTLVQTSPQAEAELSRFAIPDTRYAGLNWLLTPERLELWYEMWDTDFWVDRWQGQSPSDAMRLAEIHLNLVRSQVMQQSDRRIRETLDAIVRLDQLTV